LARGEERKWHKVCEECVVTGKDERGNLLIWRNFLDCDVYEI
jgi:hypothetical protein